MNRACLLLIIILVLPGCTFLKTYKPDDGVQQVQETAPPPPASELVRFVVDNTEGARTTLTDSHFGLVTVIVGPRYQSAAGHSCIRAYIRSTTGAEEPLAICSKDSGWTLAPRILTSN